MNIGQALEELSEIGRLVSGLSASYQSKLLPLTSKLTTLQSVSNLYRNRINTTQVCHAVYNWCASHLVCVSPGHVVYFSCD